MRTRSRHDYTMALQRAVVCEPEREETLLLLGERFTDFHADVQTIQQHVFQLNLLSQLSAISRSLQILSGESKQ